MWQKCPNCSGSGTDYSGINTLAVCSVCNGNKIINELTGLPPNYLQSSSATFGPLPEKYVEKGLENYNLKSEWNHNKNILESNKTK